MRGTSICSLSEESLKREETSQEAESVESSSDIGEVVKTEPSEAGSRSNGSCSEGSPVNGRQQPGDYVPMTKGHDYGWDVYDVDETAA